MNRDTLTKNVTPPPSAEAMCRASIRDRNRRSVNTIKANALCDTTMGSAKRSNSRVWPVLSIVISDGAGTGPGSCAQKRGLRAPAAVAASALLEKKGRHYRSRSRKCQLSQG